MLNQMKPLWQFPLGSIFFSRDFKEASINTIGTLSHVTYHKHYNTYKLHLNSVQLQHKPFTNIFDHLFVDICAFTSRVRISTTITFLLYSSIKFFCPSIFKHKINIPNIIKNKLVHIIIRGWLEL